PRLDITQTYDGLGLPAKRDQISRLPGLMDELGNQGEPFEDAQTTHYVRSSVLGGAPIAELGPSNTIHVYADGQRIARDVWGDVTFEHHNPVTGNWVTSHGYSSSRLTRRQERDPRGAELPLANPYGDGMTYVGMKFAQPLFIEGGDPFDYSTGRTIDGLPVSETEFQRRIGNGSAGVGTFVGGRTAGFVDLTGLTTLQHVDVTFDVFRSGQQSPNSDYWFYLGTFKKNIPLTQKGVKNPAANERDPRNVPHRRLTETETNTLRDNFLRILKNERCANFVRQLLKTAQRLNPDHTLVSDDPERMFNSVANGGGFYSAPTATYNTVGGSFADNTAAVYLTSDPVFRSYGKVNERAKEAFLTLKYHDMAQSVMHELMHHAGFGDTALARAVASIKGEDPVFTNDWQGTRAASIYWGKYLDSHCK
ncbi:MAG TPA: hypothetical protein VFR78_04665, partial [Pyrinomonadaceae bacterium]|nr:hypothetical protein [Pyrinomonadaceae bacterium]